MNSPNIQILLSTYNGEKHLEEAISSLFLQTITDWQLIIRDDGSTDNTQSILETLKEKNPKKIIILADGQRNLGACNSFAKLLEHATAKYIMFCDQDDVWYPDKIEATYAKMLETEKVHSDKPVLIHSDLEVVNKNLETISSSMWQYQKIDPRFGSNFKKLMAFNVVTGCTIMINQKVKEIALPISENAYMHDWWIAIKSSRYGVVKYVDRPLVKYRIHDSNVSGTVEAKPLYFFKRLFKCATVLRENVKILKMHQDLDFNLNPIDVLLTKLRITMKRVFS